MLNQNKPTEQGTGSPPRFIRFEDVWVAGRSVRVTVLEFDDKIVMWVEER